jgi:hypothetical protein
MCASTLQILRAGPPPPRVALLPDALFFTRAIPVMAGASAGEGATAPPSVASQVELALEALAPFSLAQLYHGFYWRPGSERALLFAAYRRRFTAEQMANWEGAELVLPTFAALFGAQVGPATTVIMASGDGLTAVHWDKDAVPASVWFHPFSPETTDAERLLARDGLLRRVESKNVVELTEAPQAQARRSDREIVFRSGEFVSRLPTEALAGLDIRDKDQLGQLRRAKARDIILWRVATGCVAALFLLALAEVGLFAGGMWQKARRTLLNARAPMVAQIMAAQEVANQIDDLSTKRLLPIEMILTVGSKRPPSTQFLRASTDGLYTLVVEAQTPNAGEIGAYKNALDALPACASVQIKNPQTHDKIATFTLIVTFKPGGLKPSPPPS